jgi:hypothetical protein
MFRNYEYSSSKMHDFLHPAVASVRTTSRKVYHINETKIILVPELTNVSLAVEYCQQKGGYLAAPDNKPDWQALATALVDEEEGKRIVCIHNLSKNHILGH